jgi:hypothetical protein
MACLVVGGVLLAQGRGGGAPQGPPPNVSNDPLLRGFNFRSIGPATMMGRLDDIEGADKDPMTMYIGFATGGLWKSTDAGIRWRSLFDNMPNESIGDIAIAPSDLNVVYVGTGEPNNRQLLDRQRRVRRPTAAPRGRTSASRTRSRSRASLSIRSTRASLAVAAVGHLFGPNEDRGLYKSVDGGRTGRRRSKSTRTRASRTSRSINERQDSVCGSYQRRRTCAA